MLLLCPSGTRSSGRRTATVTVNVTTRRCGDVLLEKTGLRSFASRMSRILRQTVMRPFSKTLSGRAVFELRAAEDMWQGGLRVYQKDELIRR